MDEKVFAADADPETVAAELGLKVVQWHGPALYARDENMLFAIQKREIGEPAALRLVVAPEPPLSGYIGEEFHNPRQAAAHAGLTVIEAASGENVYALDGYGRKYLVQKTGNGPRATQHDWATEDEMKQWAPRHRDPKPTTT